MAFVTRSFRVESGLLEEVDRLSAIRQIKTPRKSGRKFSSNEAFREAVEMWIEREMALNEDHA